MGFSTGVWDGNMLTITTTHVKQGWERRENIPASDEVTVIEHYVRRGDMLTHISVTDDPVYLEEPLVKSEEFVLNPDPNNFNPFWPCGTLRKVSTPAVKYRAILRVRIPGWRNTPQRTISLRKPRSAALQRSIQSIAPGSRSCRRLSFTRSPSQCSNVRRQS